MNPPHGHQTFEKWRVMDWWDQQHLLKCRKLPWKIIKIWIKLVRSIIRSLAAVVINYQVELLVFFIMIKLNQFKKQWWERTFSFKPFINPTNNLNRNIFTCFKTHTTVSLMPFHREEMTRLYCKVRQYLICWNKLKTRNLNITTNSCLLQTESRVMFVSHDRF